MKKSLAILGMVMALPILAAMPAKADDTSNPSHYYAYTQPATASHVPAQPLVVYGAPPTGQGMVQSGAPDAYHYVPKKAVDEASSRNDLRTKTGIDIGFQFSTYHYQEPEVGVNIDALKYGIHPILTASLYGGWYVRADGRFAMGSADYTGSGELDDEADYISEIRGTTGYDFMFSDFVLTPYIGLGFRYLYNDSRGITSTGASGYQRYSHYLYMPIGINPRFKVGNFDQISITFEYDQLLTGYQFSQLSDDGLGDPDITNNQNSGYGLRGDIMYEWPHWAFGPFFNYWNINQSETSCGVGASGFGECGYEPHNQTYEIGAELRYKIF
jgi:hypothetical protein